MEFIPTKAVAVGCVLLGWVYFKYIRQKNVKKKSKNDVILDCVFFTPHWIVCPANCVEKKKPCGLENCNFTSYMKLLRHLRKAKTQLDICLYMITDQEIIKIVLDLFAKRVNVRIIMDKQMGEEAHKSGVLQMRQAYIPLLTVKSPNMMHNKFVIIDNKTLMTGSANWTNTGFNGNFENLLITNEAQVVIKYKKYFDCIWNIHQNKHQS